MEVKRGKLTLNKFSSKHISCVHFCITNCLWIKGLAYFKPDLHMSYSEGKNF